MEAGADLEQAADPAADLGRSGRRRGDPRQHTKERRLAGAVPADQAQHLTLFDLEGDVLQRPDLLRLVVLPAEQALRAVGERVAQRAVRRLQLPDAVALRDPFRCDRDGHQRLSANVASVRRKYARPLSTSTSATPTLSATCPGSGAGASSTAQRQPVITDVIGLSDSSHCHFSGIALSAYGTAESSGRTWRMTGSA